MARLNMYIMHCRKKYVSTINYLPLLLRSLDKPLVQIKNSKFPKIILDEHQLKYEPEMNTIFSKIFFDLSCAKGLLKNC